MKVRGVKKSQSTSKTKAKVNVSSKGSISFDEILAVTEENEERSHLDEMLIDINKKGKELAEKRDVEILLAYKSMVRGFIEEAVNHGLKVVDRRGFGRAGRSKIMRLVSNIDEKLINLTEEMIQREQSSLKLLTKIGEIQGLLLNLYA